MTSLSDSLDALVCSLVPATRRQEPLRQALSARCKDILSSHIGNTREADIGLLADIIKRQLSQSPSPGSSVLQFTNLLSRLLDQPVLSRKHDALLFLHTLSASSSRKAPTVPGFLPSLAAPSRPRPANVTSAMDPTPTVGEPVGKTKAQILYEYRRKTGKLVMPEPILLRDTLYLLQGISGKHIRFSSSNGGESMQQVVFSEAPEVRISQPTKELIHRLSEVGYLYQLVDKFVRDREVGTDVGMIEQSLCHHLQSQLTEYYRLIAVLESQLSVGSNESDRNELRAEESGLTLRRLDVWINEWRLRMRMMSVCVGAAKDTHGGALVNLIHSYTENGDPFVRQFTDRLLEEVSMPFFATLQKWLFSGELYDPYNEFFVGVDPELAHVQYVHAAAYAGGGLAGDGGFGLSVEEDVAGDKESSLRLWENKFEFRQDMLPAFVGENFGRKIFSTGRSLNFIRYSCHDSDWVATREKLNTTERGELQYSDISGLERSIDAAYRIASQRLFDIFFDKFRLLDHLQAVKSYLLLGYGDFVDHLMETLGPSLSKPANTLYRHNLTATLETAVRSSNAQNDPPEILRRLDAEMLEYTRSEIGWDVFTLVYKIDAPLDTVLDPDSMVKYLKLFNHLWKIKRIEMTLTKGWLRAGSGTKVFIHLPELEQEWHRLRLSVAEMIHFIRQMQAYSQLEVIECSWADLMDFVHKKEGDLDALIAAHRDYLGRLVRKILLLSNKAGREEVVLNQVRDALTTILQFREAMDHFYNLCLSESSRRDNERDALRGVYTGAGSDQEATLSEQLLRALQQCKEYAATFSEKVHGIVHGLQSHTDLDCRFLGVRLSFSDFYKAKRETQQQSSKAS